MVQQVLLTSKKLDTILEAKELLIKAYETSFNIFDHVKQEMIEDKNILHLNRPLAFVEYHKAEHMSEVSRLYEMTRVFMDRKVTHYFGLSFTEFLEYPPDMCDHILELCYSRQKDELSTQKNVLASMTMEEKK